MKLTQKTSFSCPPTLNDSEVARFCREGFMLLPAAVDDATNARCCAFLDAHAAHHASEQGDRRRLSEPVELFAEDWFVENVLLNGAVAGAVRSLLGDDFGLPVLLSNHRSQCPARPGLNAQPWHHVRLPASHLGASCPKRV